MAQMDDSLAQVTSLLWPQFLPWKLGIIKTPHWLVQHPHSRGHKTSFPATFTVSLLMCPVSSDLCLVNECALFVYQRQVDWDIGTDIVLKIMILDFTKVVQLTMKIRQWNTLVGQCWCFLDVFMLKYKMCTWAATYTTTVWAGAKLPMRSPWGGDLMISVVQIRKLCPFLSKTLSDSCRGRHETVCCSRPFCVLSIVQAWFIFHQLHHLCQEGKWNRALNFFSNLLD